MNDPVSEELERRAQFDIGWKWAAVGAASIHLAVAAIVYLAPAGGHRSLTLPRVQVRITSAPLAGAAAQAAAASSSAPARPQAETKPASKKARPAEQAPVKHAIPDKREPQRRAPEAASAPAAGPAASGAREGAAHGPGGALTSTSGAIAVGAPGSGEEPFPFAYYLNRVLAVIESNWFRPEAPAGTACRVRCVIDRGGRLVEAGLEAESPIPAFDRAALRAVYASAPFPPLPQGFGGSTLTLHLEFGS